MNKTISPVYIMRAYIWELLQANHNWSKDNYGGLTPIIPVSEEPEITEFDKPYIVYGYSEDPTNRDRHFISNASMSMAIYSTNFREIVSILTTLKTAFEREDEGARNLNIWSSTIPSFQGIRFGTTNVGFLEGPSPEETEGGRESGLINIRFEYYTDYEIKLFDESTGQWV